VYIKLFWHIFVGRLDKNTSEASIIIVVVVEADKVLSCLLLAAVFHRCHLHRVAQSPTGAQGTVPADIADSMATRLIESDSA